MAKVIALNPEQQAQAAATAKAVKDARAAFDDAVKAHHALLAQLAGVKALGQNSSLSDDGKSLIVD